MHSKPLQQPFGQVCASQREGDACSPAPDGGAWHSSARPGVVSDKAGKTSAAMSSNPAPAAGVSTARRNLPARDNPLRAAR